MPRMFRTALWSRMPKAFFGKRKIIMITIRNILFAAAILPAVIQFTTPDNVNAGTIYGPGGSSFTIQKPNVGGGRPSGGNDGGGYVAPPSGPSPEEIRRQKETKDLAEAAEDANDKGVEYYKKGDWDNAVKYFTEALQYDPDDQSALHNLQRAREQAARAEQARRDAQASKLAGDQLKSIEHHGTTAKGLKGSASSTEAGKGFDTAGDPAGSLDSMVVDGRNPGKEPVVPREKRTRAIAKLEKQRDEMKKKRVEMEKKVTKLENKGAMTPEETVKLVNLKQDLSNAKNKENFYNFSITEELRKPSKSAAPKKEQKSVPVPGH